MACLATVPNTAPVLEFRCLYTADLRRKQKRWQDGRLKYHTFNRRVMLYDELWNFIGDTHWRESEDLREGNSVSLDRTSMLIQVSEPVGSTNQDLSELIERRRTNRQKSTGHSMHTHAACVQIDRTASGQSLDAIELRTHPRSIRSVLGSIADHKGETSSVIGPAPTHFREANFLLNTDEKRHEMRGSPYQRTSFASSLTGASLVLQNQPKFNRVPKSGNLNAENNHASSCLPPKGVRARQQEVADAHLLKSWTPCISFAAAGPNVPHGYHSQTGRSPFQNLLECAPDHSRVASATTFINSRDPLIEGGESHLGVPKKTRICHIGVGDADARDERHAKQGTTGTTTAVDDWSGDVVEHDDASGKSQHEGNTSRLSDEDCSGHRTRHTRIVKCGSDARSLRRRSGQESEHHRYSKVMKTRPSKRALRIVSRPKKPRLVSLLVSEKCSSRSEVRKISRGVSSEEPDRSASRSRERPVSPLFVSTKRTHAGIEQVEPIGTDNVNYRPLCQGNNNMRVSRLYQYEHCQSGGTSAESSDSRAEHHVSHHTSSRCLGSPPSPYRVDNQAAISNYESRSRTEPMAISTAVDDNVAADLAGNDSDDIHELHTQVERSLKTDTDVPHIEKASVMLVLPTASSLTSKVCQTPRRADIPYERDKHEACSPPACVQIDLHGSRHDAGTEPWSVEASDLFAWKRPVLEDPDSTQSLQTPEHNNAASKAF